MEKIALVDRNGRTFCMTIEQIADSLRAMGLNEGCYDFRPPTRENEAEGGRVFVRFKPRYMPYRFYEVWWKRLQHILRERRRIQALKREAPEDFHIKPKPFHLEKPWLQLKSDKLRHYIDV